MPVKIEPGTALAKELAKFEQFPTNYTTGSLTDDDGGGTCPVGNPYAYREYPKMLYRAVVNAQGKAVCVDPEPEATGSGVEADRRFQYELLQWQKRLRECCCKVMSEAEERVKLNDGWRHSPPMALAAHADREREVFRAAAEAAAATERMSRKAHAEYAAEEAASDQQVTDVTPKSRSRQAHP